MSKTERLMDPLQMSHATCFVQQKRRIPHNGAIMSLFSSLACKSVVGLSSALLVQKLSAIS